MKPTNILIIVGAVILLGFYVYDKKTKEKAKKDADALVLSSALSIAQTSK